MNISSYQLNHPKAYIGYTVALAITDDKVLADDVTIELVTGGVDMARRGAENLNLVEWEDDELQLTDRGEWVGENAPDWFGVDEPKDVLEEFHQARGSRERFCEKYPEFTNVAPEIAMGDPMIERLVEYLEEIHRERLGNGRPYAPGTNDLFWEIWERDAKFAGELLIRDHEFRGIILGDHYDDVEWGDGLEIKDHGQVDSIEWGTAPHDHELAIYRSAATYQLKNVCWHLGIFQGKGVQAKEFCKEDGPSPYEVQWALEANVLGYDRVQIPGDNSQEVEIHG